MNDEPGTHTNPNVTFTLTRASPQISSADGEALLAFWNQYGAIPDAAQARQRLDQVVLLARDGERRIAGFCTALAMTPPALAHPVYFWRAFIAPHYRHTRLIYRLQMASFEPLESWAKDRDYPCIGVLLELENERFKAMGRRAEWRSPRFNYVYIGKSPRGLDVRIRYFEGAKLK
ncbi:MAG TPA: hypothetical protein VFN29_04875 [Chiayiivirga sp.]|nr:hypothetical protein [Chiayiivirga sp.]